MKTPSRFLPGYVPAPVTLGKKATAVGIAALFVGGLGYGLWSHPMGWALLVVLIVLHLFLQWKGHRKLKGLAATRTTEGLCTFARAFDRRTVDTWIIRAVHDELQVYLKYPGGVCPLRATDRFDEDLHIDPDDIDALFPVVAQRTGRSTANTESNPYYGKVKTVADLVLFVNGQPKTPT